MKPKDLKFPFSWEKRRVLISDRVFYVPKHYNLYGHFDFPGWKDPQLFGNSRPVSVEYCSGNGAWIVQKAKELPLCNWVAVEKRFDRVRKIWAKIKNEGLKNLVVFCGEGYCMTKEFFPSTSVDKVFINFPDPWPKTRHAKHRIVQPLFIHEAHRILKQEGRITLVTDDPSYSDQITRVLQNQNGMESIYPHPYYVNEMEGYGASYFDTLWREKGRLIHYHEYRKKGSVHAIC